MKRVKSEGRAECIPVVDFLLVDWGAVEGAEEGFSSVGVRLERSSSFECLEVLEAVASESEKLGASGAIFLRASGWETVGLESEDMLNNKNKM